VEARDDHGVQNDTGPSTATHSRIRRSKGRPAGTG
jgi:uncharacterized protein YerC